MDERDALRISREIAGEVRKAIASMPLRERVKDVGMGKDGTPTKAADRVAEDAALEILRKERVTVVTEESGVLGEGDVFVALDPLDGTFNATQGIPVYSVSLCFSYSDKLKDAFFGYVYNLATGDEYYADSSGAYRNGERIEVSDAEELYCNAIIYYPDRKFPFERMRIFGSAATELCFFADGSFDCFLDIRPGKMLRIYDAAAGVFIAEKAGGKVTELDGESLGNKKFDMQERLNIVAANEKLHPKLLELIK
uniref:Fructose-1,6-bisphosphatase/inositol-1-monophosphatase n=1 Tax=Archaeoglobus fulgidus (strain ATCC 49558 / DSM 4304 / JCM 9628 / NBRC 100126 / VC-16) TaxID=224325 RepID=UPI000E6E5C06|nr:Chain A, Fructose-1,6-bisphosphatase/inositol-1-monophosphatase [Archaeoglobus fulgidus DSM 4304]6B65_B Chain B, Fructose-1,6-bisphosphatase/inositol-1-monophosphatase [Archaeoglobus fulgidus DSM 4304]6B66_A Chain A, Fructose-1,6-bisphosphatase/inositol-1-monophosphatase [Archaeoglobus fulgidus DSM 4304]6B66_B Chain B, Fructose-1,6-bisphosphatase/inositol-1-monophosphatase [Archaeoglobus fulgidus DSM 4304]